jgi:hypothetical protein
VIAAAQPDPAPATGDPAPPGRRARRLAILAATSLVALSAAISFLRGEDGFDDAYITYVVARSFAAGQGLSWEGVPVLAATSPFYAVVLAVLHRLLGIDIAALGAAISFVSLPLIGCCLVVIGHREGWLGSAWLAGLAIVTAPLLLTHVGSEFLPAVAAVTAASALFACGKDRAAGLALFCAAAFRLECGIAAPLLAVPVLRRASGAPRVVRAGGVAAALFAVWTAGLWAVSGTLIPASLAAKRAQADSDIGYWSSGSDLLASTMAALPHDLLGRRGEWAAAVVSAALVTGLFAFGWGGAARRGQASALATWGPIQLLLVALLGVATYPWYAIPLVVSASIVMALGWEVAGRRRGIAGWMLRAVVLAPLMTALATLPGEGSAWGPRAAPDPRRDAYRQVARTLDTFPDGTRLAAYEVGYLGYFARNPVVDLLGLVTPGVSLEAIRHGRLSEIRESLHPDLVLLRLDGGKLFEAVVGDPVEFLAKYRLEGLLLARPPLLALYRRVGLSGPDRIADDLLARAAREGRKVAFLERRNGAALAMVLRAGEAVSWSVAADRRSEVTGGAWSSPGARLDFEVRTRSDRIASHAWPGDEAPRWRGWRTELPPSGEGVRIAFSCVGPGGECWVAFPRVEIRAGS